MLELRYPGKVKHITALIYSREEVYSTAKKILIKKYGPLDLESLALPFTYTDYYRQEMGQDLVRRFISFKNLIKPDRLVSLKLFAVKTERKYAPAGKRIINIDPGYMDCAKLVLSTTKDYSHRIYLSKGIYAEVTLTYKNNQWTDLPSTFPDYRTDTYKEILTRIREIYCEQIKGSRK